jgi:hypothetical protein
MDSIAIVRISTISLYGRSGAASMGRRRAFPPRKKRLPALKKCAGQRLLRRNIA